VSKRDPLDQPGLCRHCQWYRKVKFHHGGLKPYCTELRMTLETEAVECTEFYCKNRDKNIEAQAASEAKIVIPDRYSGGYA